MGRRFVGLGVSAGRAAGPVYRMAGAPRLPESVPAVGDVSAETERATEALRVVGEVLRGLAAEAGKTAAEVLEAEALMAVDPMLIGAVGERVKAGRPAAWAITEAIAEQKAMLESLGGYLAERAADLADIRDRAVAYLLGLPMPGVPEPGEPFILVAEDLAPADTARLDPRTVLGLITRRGGPTSHTAILARAHGLPAVVGFADADALTEGLVVAVDGGTGEVAEVSRDEAAAITVEAERARQALAASSGPGRTADGHPVGLLLNVGSADDIGGHEAEGVGLFRTEFLFLGRTEPPSIGEQERAYADVFAAMAGRKVVLRTLDAGADKPLPFLGLAGEENPALGIRGLRVAKARPEVLAGQLEAVARAAESTGAEVWVMAPMVATHGEAAWFADCVRAAGLAKAGVMIEVPSAALLASRILEHVDFLSIGTNDLSQYTLAADRMSADLAELLDPWQPAVLHLVDACARAGQETGKPVGICGEAAGDPLLAPVFAGMGITSLSMSGAGVPAVRAALATRTLAECRELAAAVLAAPDAVTARRAGSGR